MKMIQVKGAKRMEDLQRRTATLGRVERVLFSFLLEEIVVFPPKEARGKQKQGHQTALWSNRPTDRNRLGEC